MQARVAGREGRKEGGGRRGGIDGGRGEGETPSTGLRHLSWR